VLIFVGQTLKPKMQ